MLLLWIFASAKVCASIYVVHDTEESSVRSLTFQLSKLLLPSTQPTPIRSLYFARNEPNLNADDVVITVGIESFQQVCDVMSKGTLIAVFVGQEEYLKSHTECLVPTSAVFSGAPLEKRLTLLAAVWPDRKPLALIASDNLLIDQARFSAIAKEYGFTFQFLKTNVDKLSVLKSVNYALEESELIFSLVDSKLYKNDMVKDILKLLHHKQKLMVGSSSAFARAGSLFAIDTSGQAKLTALVELVNTWRSSGKLLNASYPSPFRVTFNPYLIRAHSIVLPSASYLKDQYDLCSDNVC